MLKCYGSGFCAHDPELKYIGQSQTAQVQVTVCFNRSYRRGEQWEQETAFVRCKAWGKLAERMSAVLAKGKLVTVEGFICQENWTSSDNQKRSMLILRVERFQPCEKFQPNAPGGDRARTAPPNASSPAGPDEVPPADADDADVPF